MTCGATPTVVLVSRLLINSTAGDDVTLISVSVMGFRGFHDMSCNTNCFACLKTADELHSRLWCYIDISDCYRLQFVCQWVEWLQCSDVSMLLYCCWGAKLTCWMMLSFSAPGREFHDVCNTNCGACLKTADELHSRLWCYIDISECYGLQFVFCLWVVFKSKSRVFCSIKMTKKRK